MPSNRRLQIPPGRTGSLARGSYYFRKRSLCRSRCEHGGVGFGPVGRSGLVLQNFRTGEPSRMSVRSGLSPLMVPVDWNQRNSYWKYVAGELEASTFF